MTVAAPCFLRAVCRAVLLVLTPGLGQAAEPAATLALHVAFLPADVGGNVRAVEQVNQRPLEVRGAVRAVPFRGGYAVEFAGHPGQAVVLGVLALRPPLTLALWLKRTEVVQPDPAGSGRPEYLPEAHVGQGRILSPLTGTPRAAATQSGVLRLGRDGLQVWHGPAKWSPVVVQPLSAGEWLHLTVTFAADLTATGYVNGTVRGVTRSDFDLGPGPVALAAAALDRGFGFPFAGLLADVRFYRGVLSPSEINALAAKPPES